MTTKNAIEAAKITKKLKNFTLDVENFAIPQGFATALIGENGAGKTTLLNILAGIRLDYKGEITYFGQYSDKQKENSGDIKNRIGYTGPVKYRIYMVLFFHLQFYLKVPDQRDQNNRD